MRHASRTFVMSRYLASQLNLNKPAILKLQFPEILDAQKNENDVKFRMYNHSKSRKEGPGSVITLHHLSRDSFTLHTCPQKAVVLDLGKMAVAGNSKQFFASLG